VESRLAPKGEPTPGDGGRPEDEAMADDGGGQVPRMEARNPEEFGEAARTVVVVGTEGGDGTERLLDEPPVAAGGDLAG